MTTNQQIVPIHHPERKPYEGQSWKHKFKRPHQYKRTANIVIEPGYFYEYLTRWSNKAIQSEWGVVIVPFVEKVTYA